MSATEAGETGCDRGVLALTREEADALLQLIDIALKAAGLSVAQAAVHLASRVVAARDAAAPTMPVSGLPARAEAPEEGRMV